MSNRRSMQIPHLALAVTVALSLAASAFAVTKYVLAKHVFETQISGRSGDTGVIPSQDDHQILFGVDLWEQGDRPCKFRARTRHVNTNATDSFVADTHRCLPSSRSKKSIQFSKTNEFVRGIQVCLNSKGNKVKGIKIYGARLDVGAGTLTNISTPKKLERANCKDWKNAVYCPNGMLAHQVRAYWWNFWGTGDLRGLSLRCRKLKKQ